MAMPIMGATHNHYQLEVEGLSAELDVLSFNGKEGVSQPFNYTIAFTSPEQDIARHGLEISSTEDQIRITAKKKITLNAGGSYIAIDACSIESGTEGDCLIKAASFEYIEGPAKQVAETTSMPALADHDPDSLKFTVFSG